MDRTTFVITVAIAALLGAATALSFNALMAVEEATSPADDLATKVAQLERRLGQERKARQELVEAIQSATLFNSGKEFNSAAEEEFRDPSVELQEPEQIEEELEIARARAELESSRFNTDDPQQYRRQILAAGGFTQDEVEWVLENESQVQLEQLYSQHELQRQALAENTVESQAWLQRQFRSNRLREKLGDENYERYLKANGSPASANILSVIKDSPAARAGIQPGDEITSYAGRRVFNMLDVSRLSLEGEQGESVLIEVQRDGSPVQITVPRGPLGVSSNNRRFNR